VQPKSVAEVRERNHLDINANALTLRKMCANETALALQLCQYLWVVNPMTNVLWTRLVITHVVLILVIVGLIASAMSSTTNPCAMLQQDSLETPKLNVKNLNVKSTQTAEQIKCAIKTNVLIPVY
jgi:hypothetical protein